VKELTEDLMPLVDAFLRQNPFINAYALWDLHYLRHRAKFFVGMDCGKIVGLLLDYLGHTGFHFIWLWGDEKVCDKLLDVPLPEKMIFCVFPELERIIERNFPITVKYQMDFMLLEKGNERLYLRHRIKPLSLEDAYSLACLRKEKPSKKEVEETEIFIKEQPFYGIFKNFKLVSVACIQVKFPEIWMLGGFYTHPEHRNHGYATSLASFLAKKALKETNHIGLHVRSDNYPAKRVYEKVGFKEHKTLYWLDFRTGLTP
jgi:RimJ/RimL family protein N-acetyltransferase